MLSEVIVSTDLLEPVVSDTSAEAFVKVSEMTTVNKHITIEKNPIFFLFISICLPYF